MLARASTQLPAGQRWVYEPKLDGFRACLAVAAKGARITSRLGLCAARSRPFHLDS